MNTIEENKAIILDHYKNPRNFGKPMWNPTNTNKVSNLSCGDEVTFYLSISGDEIQEVCFEGEGCSICIGSASILSDIIKNFSVAQVLKISLQDFQTKLGVKLNSSRLKCVEVSLDALQGAVESQNH